MASKDVFHRLKYIAYCRSQLPPEEVGTDYADFVDFAKHFLCVKTNRLFKDPIWETYTNEEILIEYFSYEFQNEQKRIDFEKELLNVNSESIDDWLVSQSSKSKPVEPVELEDKIEFSPDSLGD